MYYYIHISERIYSYLCRVKRIFYRNPKSLNGHAPFFLAILDPLDKNERIYSDFYALFKPILAIIVGGLNRSDWVGMLRFQHAVQDKCNRYIKCIEFSDQAFIIPPVTAWCLFAIIFSLSSFFGLIIVANTLVWNSRMIWHITFIISGFAIATISAIVLVYKYLMKGD